MTPQQFICKYEEYSKIRNRVGVSFTTGEDYLYKFAKNLIDLEQKIKQMARLQVEYWEGIASTRSNFEVEMAHQPLSDPTEVQRALASYRTKAIHFLELQGLIHLQNPDTDPVGRRHCK